MGHTFIKFGFRVLQDVSSNARLISTIRNILLQRRQQLGQILIPPRPVLLRPGTTTRPQSQQRDVVLPIIARAPEIRNLTLDMRNLLQQSIFNVSINSEPVIQRQRRVQRISLEVAVWVNVLFAVVAVSEHFLNADVRLEIDDGHVGLRCRTVEGCAGGFTALFA